MRTPFIQAARISSAVALSAGLMMSYAQQGLVGTYVGEYRERQPEGYPRTQTATLEITSAQSGKLTGKYNLASFGCGGTYEVEGTYQDNKLDMRTKSGALRGCGDEQLMPMTQGNKLVGKVGAYEIELLRK